MSNPVLKAKVKKDGRIIEVYKLSSGGYQIYLGEKMNLGAINEKAHWESFKKEELEFIS